jgi:hypothetical protein
MQVETGSAVACCVPLAAPVLDAEEAEATAELFRALGDPARVRIVNRLATGDGPVCVCELTEPLGLSQPTSLTTCGSCWTPASSRASSAAGGPTSRCGATPSRSSRPSPT